MARPFTCFFVLFILSIAVRFGDCENNNPECNDENIIPGSEETRLSKIEAVLKGLISPMSFMDKIFKKNLEFEITGSFGEVLEKFSDYIHLIYPGTLWCGSGDIAKDKDDLGIFKRTDACCRAHDKCMNAISGGKTKLNLKNNGIFTRSACTCDRQFYDCLKNAKSPIASKIGFTYFSILQQQCFECICPNEDCNLEDATKCEDQCKRYEWVNNKRFYNLSI